jgi:FG-GAP-like repeat/FG-GAP repeat
MNIHRGRAAWLAAAVAVVSTAVLLASGPGAVEASSPRLVDRAAEAGLKQRPTPSWDVTTVDYDKDGDTDFSMSLHWTIAGELRRNNGDGTFTRVAGSGAAARIIMPRPNELGGVVDRHACTWADFDRNGLPDAYCSAGRLLNNSYKTESINNELWRQTSVGVFTDTATASRAGEPCARGRHVATLDVNGDGWQDLFVGARSERSDPDDPCNTQANHPYNEQSKILINRRRGTGGAWLGFRFGTKWNVSQPNSGARFALPWDYNHDGRTDLLAGGGRRALLYRNTGTGFAEVSQAARVALRSFNGASIADITGDAIPDLVFADDRGFAYRAGTRTGISRTTVRLGPATSGGVGSTTAVGDINGDGRADVYGQVASAAPAGGNPDDLVFVASPARWQRHVVPRAGGDADDVAAVRIGRRAQFVVLNGDDDEGVASPGPVQLIAWR